MKQQARHIRFFSIVLLLILGCAPKDSTRTAAQALGLNWQAEVKDADMFADGGTIGFILTDGFREIPCCYDGRMIKTDPDRASPRPLRHLFVGALHPDRAGAEMIPICGEREQAIRILLKDWYENRATEEYKHLKAGVATPPTQDFRNVHYVAQLLEYLDRDSTPERKYANDLGLEGSIDIPWIQKYEDGGTVGFVLEDQEKKIEACLDGRMESADEENDRPLRHFFVGALHPTHAGARSIPIKGVEEKAIVGLLSEWVNSRVSVNDQFKILKKTCPDVGPAARRWQAVRLLYRVVRMRDERKIDTTNPFEE